MPDRSYPIPPHFNPLSACTPSHAARGFYFAPDAPSYGQAGEMTFLTHRPLVGDFRQAEATCAKS